MSALSPVPPSTLATVPPGQKASVLDQYGNPLISQDANVPHVYYFVGLYNQASRVYSWRWDECYRNSNENALAMRRDASLMSRMEELYDELTDIPWHLEAENAQDPMQQLAAQEMTQNVQAIPYFARYMRSLCEAIWYGRSGVNQVWGPQDVSGRRAHTVVNHQMLNGDKIQYTWDGYPSVQIYTPISKQIEDRGGEVRYTDRNPVLVFNTPYWRQQLAIHKAWCIDADFFDSEMAGGIHGVGIRNWICWIDFMRKEVLSWMMDFLERTGLGLNIYYYLLGDPQSKQAAEDAARQDGRNTVVVWPLVGEQADRKKGPGFERQEVSLAGAETIQQVIKYFDDIIERFIIGQTLSSDHRGSGGLGGSGAARFQSDTKYKKIKAYAKPLADTLTMDLLRPMQRFNRPQDRFRIRWVFDLDDPQMKDRLEAAKTLYLMRVPMKTDEVRSIAGFSKPEPEDETILDTDPQGEEGGVFGGGNDDDDSGEGRNGDSEGNGSGESDHVQQNGSAENRLSGLLSKGNGQHMQRAVDYAYVESEHPRDDRGRWTNTERDVHAHIEAKGGDTGLTWRQVAKETRTPHSETVDAIQRLLHGGHLESSLHRGDVRYKAAKKEPGKKESAAAIGPEIDHRLRKLNQRIPIPEIYAWFPDVPHEQVNEALEGVRRTDPQAWDMVEIGDMRTFTQEEHAKLPKAPYGSTFGYFGPRSGELKGRAAPKLPPLSSILKR
jgi:hypothetical protein